MSSQKRSRAHFESDAPPSHAPYAYYGTALPAYDPEVRDDGSYVPVWKQEVTDERGRKRLHGAFTGGFSAGYYNTVGSKEGWAPATFVSSRTKRATTSQQQRAEDFMDDEDLAEQAESQKLETQDAFAGLGSGNAGAGSKGLFSDLFRATGETMGVKLLQRMGWRQGQGIGPKVRRKADGDKTGEGHLFAPEDSPMISFNRKTDRKGLGFAGETSIISQTKEEDEDEQGSDADARILSVHKSRLANKPKKAAKSSSFGIGVLNDTGSDDEDPYTMGPQIKYNRIIGGSKSKKKGSIVASNATPRPNIPSKLTQRSSNIMAGFRKCHDGRLPIEGFLLMAKPLTSSQENQYSPPEVPAGWQSSKGSAETTTQPATYQSTADAAKVSTLDARARSNILGEQTLPGKSVFDFLTPEARNKLAAATGKDNLPQARSEGRPEGFEESNSRTLWDVIPRLDRETALAALQRGSRGWMPYSEDEQKRARYKSFLSLQAGLHSTLPERPTGHSTEEWIKEMREFAQAAEVFKPISGLMATRFTSSNASPQIASDRPDAKPQQGSAESPAEEAAAAGMFGPLTRSREAFHPTRLLCKRFNVKPPANVEVDPGVDPGEADADMNLVNKASIDRMMMHANFKIPSFASGGIQTEQDDLMKTRQQERASIDAGINEALERGRADESTLKSVFEDE